MKCNHNNRRILPIFLVALTLFASFDLNVSAETTKTIQSFDSLSQTTYTYDVGTSKSDVVSQLPESLTASVEVTTETTTTDDEGNPASSLSTETQSESVNVGWASSDYNAGQAGDYTFTASLNVKGYNISCSMPTVTVTLVDTVEVPVEENPTEEPPAKENPVEVDSNTTKPSVETPAENPSETPAVAEETPEKEETTETPSKDDNTSNSNSSNTSENSSSNTSSSDNNSSTSNNSSNTSSSDNNSSTSNNSSNTSSSTSNSSSSTSSSANNSTSTNSSTNSTSTSSSSTNSSSNSNTTSSATSNNSTSTNVTSSESNRATDNATVATASDDVVDQSTEQPDNNKEENVQEIPVTVTNKTETKSEFSVGKGKAVINLEKGKSSDIYATITDDETLLRNILTDEQLKRVAEGATVNLKISTDIVSVADISKEDADKIDSDLENYRKDIPGLNIAGYVDISIYLQIDDDDWSYVSNTNKPVELVINVPDSMKGLSSSYYIMRLHDGETTLFNDNDDDPNTVTISTGKFSIYVIMYDSEAAAEIEKTEKNEMNLLIVFVIVLVAVLLVQIVYIFAIRKKLHSVEQ